MARLQATGTPRPAEPVVGFHGRRSRESDFRLNRGFQVFKGKLLEAIKAAGLTLPAALPETWVVDCRYAGDGQKALLYGPHAHRRRRRDHRTGGGLRNRHQHEQVSQRQVLRVMAGRPRPERPARLCPGTKITGSEVLSGRTKHCANRTAQAPKLAAAALRSSQSALGPYFRRLSSGTDLTIAPSAPPLINWPD